jgi:hypothetical protein
MEKHQNWASASDELINRRNLSNILTNRKGKIKGKAARVSSLLQF